MLDEIYIRFAFISHMRAHTQTDTLRKEGQGEEGGSWSPWVIVGRAEAHHAPVHT